MKKALLIIDIQNDFCKNGSLEVKDANNIIPIVNSLIKKFDKNNDLVIATKDWHPKSHKSFAVNSNKKIGDFGELNGLPQVFWPVHCVQNTFGAEFHSELFEIKNVVYKGTDENIDSYSGFFDNGMKSKTELDNILKSNEIDTLFIAGLATDYCVKFTVIDALELDYKVYLIKDACKGVNLNTNDSKEAIDEMKSYGNGAKVILSSDIL